MNVGNDAVEQPMVPARCPNVEILELGRLNWKAAIAGRSSDIDTLR